ncbi:hypothetical protein F511_36916 [Dorcoceras hygrometricum]|uniref:Dystroglycan-like n=1 Tax=Dorcoceras hygrometricum TaxID=472368 RepID=A0A2Z7CFS5_9LAMI|nr:hypothetical protein F511_36916 [Dorcoceras hygrometricum]
MDSSFYSNAQHVDFESVLSMDDHEMVSMFEALMASGLRGFLGCPAVVYEDALVDFFENASVRNGVIISTVGGQLVEISEALFAESFELPVDGLGDLSEMPKDAIFDARSIVSLSGEPISLSGRKNQMKMPFRLLCDILAKAISVKAESFNAITVEKFSLITAVVCRIKMNWAKYLFSILLKMVSPGSKKAKGFTIQISLLLATFPTLELGESSEFQASKILSKKTVHRFVSVNNRDGAEEVSRAVKQRAVSKKRPAADVGAAVPKKKRSFKKKSISSISTMELVAVAEEAIPIQQVEEPSAVEEPRCPSADDVDLIIQQVLVETREFVAPADTAQPAVSEEKHWFDLPYDDLVKQWEAERPVVTASDTEEDIATMDVAPADGDQQVEEFVAPISAEVTLSANEQMSLDDILLKIPVDIPLPSSCMEVTFCSVFIDLSLFNWLPSTDISEFLLSIALDRTVLRSVQRFQDSSSVAPSVQLSLEQHQSSSSSDSSSSLHFDQTDIDATASSRPHISPDISAAFADFQAALSEQIFVSQSDISSRMHKLEQSVCDSLRDQADIFRNLSHGARQEVRTLDDVHTIRFNEFRKNVLTQNASIFQGLADVRQVVEAVNAKVDIMASRVNAIQKDDEATKEALSHQLLEFQSSAQENHNVIHAQLSELVDYIHRGSADKKGESGSRGLQQPANIQIEGSAVTPTFEQRVQMAQRRIVNTVLNADANRALLESQDAAERDRERRRKEAKSIFIYNSDFSSWGFQVVIQQLICFQWLIRIQRDISNYFIKEHSADVAVSTSEYRFKFQRVLLSSTKRQHFDKLERRRGVHSFVSADEVISRSFLEKNQQLLSLFVESCNNSVLIKLQRQRLVKLERQRIDLL